MRTFLTFLKFLMSALLVAVGVKCFNTGQMEWGIGLCVIALVHWIFWPQPKTKPKASVTNKATAESAPAPSRPRTSAPSRKVDASGARSTQSARRDSEAERQRREAERRRRRDEDDANDLLLTAAVLASTDNDSDSERYNIGSTNDWRSAEPSMPTRSEPVAAPAEPSGGGYSGGGGGGGDW